MRISIIKDQMHSCFNKVRENNPLVGAITNVVSINLVVNCQLAIGGSPGTVFFLDEAIALADCSQSFYINLGAMSPVYKETLPKLVNYLNKINNQWILDPVAVGNGQFRHNFLQSIKTTPPKLIKGNASEIIALSYLWELHTNKIHYKVKGVDATNTVTEAIQSAQLLAKSINGVVVVTGDKDIITDGNKCVQVSGGSKMMTHLTGAGCALGGILSMYASQSSPFIAALTAVSTFNIAGERAERQSVGPLSFQTNFVDELYQLTGEDIQKNTDFKFINGVENYDK